MRSLMASWLLAAPLALMLPAAASAVEGPPYLLHEGTWVCGTPEAYDQAIAEQAKTNGYKELMALRQRLLDAQLCMYLDDDAIEDMMAPFVEVIERQGDKIKVTFTIEFYKKQTEIHAGFNRVTFAGWTGESRLADYHPLSG